MSDAAETRAALELVCETLRRKMKISYIDAECLRRAKHDDVQVRPEMWALIIDLLEIQDLPESKPLKRFFQPLPQCKEMQGQGTQNDHGKSKTEGLGFKHAAIYSLSVLGYPRADKLFTAVDPNPVETDSEQKKHKVALENTKGTRELLLAFAFLLEKMDLLTDSQGKLPPYPQDISSVPDMGPKDNKFIGSNANTECIHTLLQVHSKWQNEIRRLQQLEVHRLDVLRRLQALGSRSLASVKAGVKTKIVPPTEYELYVLERPGLFAEHILDLEREVARSSNLKKEDLFWRWMGSVLKVADANEAVEHVFGDRSDLSHWMSSQDISSSNLLESLDFFPKSLQTLEQRSHLYPNASWGDSSDLRQHWETHKLLPQEMQRKLKAELRNLGLSFDNTLPSPWQAHCLRSFATTQSKAIKMADLPQALPGHSQSSHPLSHTKQEHNEKDPQNTKAVKPAREMSRSHALYVTDLRERYAKTMQRHMSFRSSASQKLEAAVALAKRDVFVTKRGGEHHKHPGESRSMELCLSNACCEPLLQIHTQGNILQPKLFSIP